MSNIRWIIANISAIKWGFLLSILFLLLETVCIVTMTGVQKWIIEDVFRQENYDLLIPVILVFVGAIVLYNLFHLIAFMIRRRNNLIIQKKLIGDLLHTMYRMPVSRYHNERIGALVNYATRDANSASNTISNYVPNGLQTVFHFILLSVIIGLANPLILMFTLVVSICFIGLGKFFAPRLKAASKEVQSSSSKLLVTIEEGISSTREVIAYHRMKWEQEKYNSFFQEYYKRVMNEGKLMNKQMFFSDPLRWSVNLLVLGYGGYAVIQGSLSLGLFVIIYQFSSQLVDAGYRTYTFVTGFSGQMANVERVKHFVEGDQVQEGGRSLDHPIEQLQFEQVSFRYGEDQPLVLNELSLDLPIGRKIAFVGMSGGGKSTISQLLIRFFEPEQGNIIVNRVPLSTYSRKDWQRRVGIVFQEPYLFPDTIRNNLLLGRSTVSEEQMMFACKQMCIHDFIIGLPEGYDTEVGERGLKLSGGQRQRLALARTVIADPEIMILDEATSALDMETERQLQKNLDELRKGRTTIIIAHRLSTVQNADLIYVLDQGQIAEMGTHDSLMLQDSIYKSLVHAQTELEKEA